MQKCNEALASVDQNNLEKEEAQASGSDVSVTDFLSVEVEENEPEGVGEDKDISSGSESQIVEENVKEGIDTDSESEVFEENLTRGINTYIENDMS